MDFGSNKEMIQLISNNLLDLQELNMERLEGSTFIGIVLPSIKSLRIRSLMSVNNEDWHEICRSLLNIQKFSIKTIYQMSSLCTSKFQIFSQGWMNLMKNSKHLKSVSIPAVFKDENPQSADLLHNFFEKVHGPRLYYKSCKHIPKEHAGL